MDKGLLVRSLEAVATFAPSTLEHSGCWFGFSQESIVQIEVIAHPIELFGQSLYLCFSQMRRPQQRCSARRYGAPFAVRVLDGAYVSRWSEEETDSVPPTPHSVELRSDCCYACTRPRAWQSISMLTELADNLVVVGPVYDPAGRPTTGTIFPQSSLSRSRISQLRQHFRRKLLLATND